MHIQTLRLAVMVKQDYIGPQRDWREPTALFLSKVRERFCVRSLNRRERETGERSLSVRLGNRMQCLAKRAN